MSKIIINNLGPVKSFEQDVDDRLLLLIGEQASGKSTVAKMIFYCKSISEELKKFLADANNLIEISNGSSVYTNFKKRLRTKFLEYFGTTKHMDYFSVQYYFDEKEYVTIRLNNGYADIIFSNKLKEQCKALIETFRDYYLKQENMSSSQMLDFKLWSDQRNVFVKMIDYEVNKIFRQDYTSIFVPAGRSMLSTNSEFFHTLTPNKYDILMNDFIERITILQKQYSQRMIDIVEDRKKLSSQNIDFKSVYKAMSLIKQILKGEYMNDKTGERIYYEDDRFVKLVQASSGQQEALWIVLLLFSVILDHQKIYLVIEEPEAHLFPTAQKQMLELITLMINVTGSSVILTTHSPYVLTAENLLMYSSHVEKESDSENDIVASDLRLPQSLVSAYLLKGHEAIDIMDRENNMIDASRIDTVSEELNTAVDRLVEQEMKNELR